VVGSLLALSGGGLLAAFGTDEIAKRASSVTSG
jgi:hypothetical protein